MDADLQLRDFIARAVEVEQVAPRTVPIYSSYLNGPQEVTKVVREATTRRSRRYRL